MYVVLFLEDIKDKAILGREIVIMVYAQVGQVVVY